MCGSQLSRSTSSFKLQGGFAASLRRFRSLRSSAGRNELAGWTVGRAFEKPPVCVKQCLSRSGSAGAPGMSPGRYSGHSGTRELMGVSGEMPCSSQICKPAMAVKTLVMEYNLKTVFDLYCPNSQSATTLPLLTTATSAPFSSPGVMYLSLNLCANSSSFAMFRPSESRVPEHCNGTLLILVSLRLAGLARKEVRCQRPK
mmetsp:Transcript_33809/g.78576  ORF Transcript_33809/g.78576 Transcript_33809/m.78576 type:complete len:200 (+) Transcript_33809:766-1365(+)